MAWWWLLTVVVVAFHSASAAVVESTWEVEYKYWWPDCKEGIVMAINGQFPGPTIDAFAGDTVIIHVVNKLSTESVVIHWHGIRQKGTPWADGAAGVTQCPINPGETFTYKFMVDKAGTHFYHGHYGMQRSAGLYGMLIVRSPKERIIYDGEFNLLLSDWWHQSIHSQELALSSRPMRWIGEPQSLLINGRGQFNCSQAAYFNKGGEKDVCTFKENDQCAPQTLRVEPNRVYRLRIASTTALASLNLAVQNGTAWADGAAGVTQCPINPGETFTYSFIVDKPGTYFYHGHYGMQRSAGLYGMLIVKSPEETLKYDGEFNLLLSDWWHKSIHAQELALSSQPMRWIGEPKSLLINGKGQFNCSQAAYITKKDDQCTFKGKDEDQCAPHTLRVEPNRVYRLRIASTTALASLNLAIDEHELEVVEADGNYVKPFNVSDIDIYSGETYSVLLRTNGSISKKYWISVGVRGRKPETPPALTMLYYVNAPEADRPANHPPETPRWDDFDRSITFTKKIFAAEGTLSPPEKSEIQLILLNTQNLLDNYTKWSINNVSLSVPVTPYLGSIKYGLKSAEHLKSSEKKFAMDNYDIMKPPANPNTTKGSGIYSFTSGKVVDVILQNANVLTEKVSEIHPWHLHGHDFWVLGYGDGKFKPGIDEKTFNLKNPPLRNTVVLYPYGWTALRFVTDNPGVWFFHCHIEPHLHMGMGVIFAEAVDQIDKTMIPHKAFGCGLTREWFMKHVSP